MNGVVDPAGAGGVADQAHLQVAAWAKLVGKLGVGDTADGDDDSLRLELAPVCEDDYAVA